MVVALGGGGGKAGLIIGLTVRALKGAVSNPRSFFSFAPPASTWTPTKTSGSTRSRESPIRAIHFLLASIIHKASPNFAFLDLKTRITVFILSFPLGGRVLL